MHSDALEAGLAEMKSCGAGAMGGQLEVWTGPTGLRREKTSVPQVGVESGQYSSCGVIIHFGNQAAAEQWGDGGLPHSLRRSSRVATPRRTTWQVPGMYPACRPRPHLQVETQPHQVHTRLAEEGLRRDGEGGAGTWGREGGRRCRSWRQC